ncbi:hypothetical protein OEZ86_008112 [Tetradesmus obliquus]|nr:hypothetical protein OEZ86_008112 [Tetradesmus obliquus]
MGFTADIIIWDVEARQLLHRLQLQKVKIQALSFSADESMLASLGGQDDNSLVLWDVASGEAICGSPTHQDFVLCCRFFNNQPDKLMTCGNCNLQIWTYDRANNKLRPEDVKLGNLQRQFRSLVIDQQDRFAYAGSTTGDVMQVSLEHALLRNTGPGKHPLQLSVTAATETPAGTILLGSGDGTLALLSTEAEPNPANPKQLKKLPVLTSIRLEGGITSIEIDPGSGKAVPLGRNPTGGGIAYTAYIGTDKCNMYRVAYDPINNKLSEDVVQTAHPDKIFGLAFPANYGEVFATCSAGGIRVWHLAGCRELLRISLPNLDCKCVTFAPDGKSIISGWSDGKIRGFGPQSGKLLYTINDAHHKAVTAIAVTSDSNRIISGGEEGMVRVWRLGKQSQTMEASMKDHKGPVNCIVVKASTDDECVSASSDGSCIIWDLNAGRRRQSLFANTFFLSVVYHPDESQLVTAGTDRKITYWDAYDGQAIRIIDGSDQAQLNALATEPDGAALLSGGSDKLVKLWGYDEGRCWYVGVGHSGEVTALAVAPDKSAVVSVGAEGGIFIWDYMRPPMSQAE